jgi:hypothetical protein
VEVLNGFGRTLSPVANAEEDLRGHL